LLFVDPDADDMHGYLNTVEKPFNELNERELCPGSAVLEKLNASLR
jgi:2-oxoglutarate ferredoxin oxidoreductase subunit beta